MVTNSTKREVSSSPGVANPLGGATFAWMLLMDTRISKRVGLNRRKGRTWRVLLSIDQSKTGEIREGRPLAKKGWKTLRLRMQ